MQLKIRVIPESDCIIDNFRACTGEIIIGSFHEYFTIPLDFWTIEEYQSQWATGLARIQSTATSCLVAAMRDPRNKPLLNWWVMYRSDNKIFIRNQLICAENYLERVGYHVITPYTCYDFIRPRRLVLENGAQPSEWILNL